MNCIDAGYVGDTLQSSAKIGESGEVISAPGWWVIVTSIIFWMFGVSLVSFFTGAITNFLDSRREDIVTGNVDYTFSKNYVLVVGVDFQVKNLVKSVMVQFADSSVVIISDTDVTGLYADMEAELSKGDMLRLYIMRKSICAPESYSRMKISGAKEIYVIGDENTPGRDGMALKAMDLISQKCHDEIAGKNIASIKTYLHIEDSIFYSQVRAIELPADKIEHSHRHTGLSQNAFILSAIFKFPHTEFDCDPVKVRLDWAVKNQDLSVPNCGSLCNKYNAKIMKFTRAIFRPFPAGMSQKKLNWPYNKANNPIYLRAFFAKTQTLVCVLS
jgi:hypothetical protein